VLLKTFRREAKIHRRLNEIALSELYYFYLLLFAYGSIEEECSTCGEIINRNKVLEGIK